MDSYKTINQLIIETKRKIHHKNKCSPRGLPSTLCKAPLEQTDGFDKR